VSAFSASVLALLTLLPSTLSVSRSETLPLVLVVPCAADTGLGARAAAAAARLAAKTSSYLLFRVLEAWLHGKMICAQQKTQNMFENLTSYCLVILRMPRNSGR
jgi:hypothetical protein